jgi:hypothetical protein
MVPTTVDWLTLETNMNVEAIEILTPEEFLERMKIGRTTFFKWKKEGRLQVGRDFIQKGRILRVLWGVELLKRLLETSDESVEKKPQEKAAKQKGGIVPPRKRTTAINFEY